MSTILGQLYEGWPARYNFDALEVAAETGTLRPEEGLSDGDMAVWSGLILWLEREGIITIGGSSLDGQVMAAHLTAKGHEALERPAPGSPEKTIASRMSDLAKATTKTATGEATKEVGKAAGRELAELAGAFVGSIGKAFTGPG